MTAILAPLMLGLLFGVMLHKAGLTHYARIVNVYRLTDMTVMQFMLVALVVGAVLDQVAVDLGVAAALPVPATFPLAHIVGGLIFGVGMASAGYCPGTIVAEAGEGRLDAWLAGIPGLIVGAIVFGALEPHVMPALSRVASLGRATLASLTGANPWLILAIFVELAFLVLRWTRRRPRVDAQAS